MWIFDKPPDELKEDDLAAMTGRDCETRSLEYKLEYSGGKNKREETKEWAYLQDITGMANAAGGVIVVGMRQKVGDPRGMAEELVGIEPSLQFQKWAEDLNKSCVDPPIIGLSAHNVSLRSGREAVVIHIPASTIKPHAVKNRGRREFYIRHERQVLAMSMGEIRSAILDTFDLDQKLRGLIDRRREEAVGILNGSPAIRLYGSPLTAPRERINAIAPDVAGLIRKPPSLHTVVFDSPRWEPSPVLWGSQGERSTEGVLRNRARIEHSGFCEYCATLSTPPGRQVLPPLRLEVAFFWGVCLVRKLMEVHFSSEPFVVGAELLNVSNMRLDLGGEDSDAIWRSAYLQLPEARPFSAAEWDHVPKLWADRLWNGFGFPGSASIGEDGRLATLLDRNTEVKCFWGDGDIRVELSP